jgi:hypothetical protein
MSTRIVTVSELKIKLGALMAELEERGIPSYVLHSMENQRLCWHAMMNTRPYLRSSKTLKICWQ